MSSDEDDDIRRIDSSLSELMRLTTSQRIHDNRARATGVHLSRTLSRLLATVDELGPVSVSRLAAVMDVSQPTASRSLLHLEEEGYVARAGDPADGRVVMYAVTSRGRRARQRLRDHMREQMAAALEGMSEQRRGQLAELLADFVERLYHAGGTAAATGRGRTAGRVSR